MVSVAAVPAADGSAVCLSLANTRPAQTVTLSVKPAGLARKSVSGRVLTALAMKAHNTLGEPAGGLRRSDHQGRHPGGDAARRVGDRPDPAVTGEERNASCGPLGRIPIPIGMPLLLALLSAILTVPAAAQTWASAWGGRGPLSTTITTDHTFREPVPDLSGCTLRVMAHLTTGGAQVRVRLSQRFASLPLGVGAAHVAVRSSGSGIVAGTDRALTFGGTQTVTVTAGGDVWSDPAHLTVGAGQDVAISIYVPGSFTPTMEGGRGQLKTAYYQAGNQVSASSFSRPGTTRQVFVVYEVQVRSPGPAATIVTLGDSITEGACSDVDANGDWPDLLATRLPSLPDGTAVAVLNAGIGSGRLASSDGAGLRGLTRLGELLAPVDVRWVTVLMGVNDISYEHVEAAFLENACAEAIAKVHAAGKRIIGIPILPFGHSAKDVDQNKRVARDVNAWIRAHDRRLGAPEPSYDAVIDFEPVMKDPNDPAWALRPELTCDKVHPNEAGYRAMADAIPLEVFN